MTFFPRSPSFRLELKCTFMLVKTMGALAQNENIGMVKNSAHWLGRRLILASAVLVAWIWRHYEALSMGPGPLPAAPNSSDWLLV